MNTRELKFNYDDFNKKKLIKIIEKFGGVENISICYFSTYKINYTRTEYLLNLFNEIGIKFEVVTSDRKGVLKYFDCLKKLFKVRKKHDLVFVSFRGQEILPFVKLLIPRKKIIFDAFVSIYDTLCFDRQIFSPKSIFGKFFKFYDTFLCKISNLVLVDTKTHADYFSREFSSKNIDYLYVGCNQNMFNFKQNKKIKNDKFTVFWYGYANPLQGADVILRAAEILKDNKNIRFVIGGPVEDKYSELVKELNLDNVTFLGGFPYNTLPNLVASSDLCLGGHFSKLPKATRVIPGKAFQFHSVGKNMILGDCPANRELFLEGETVSYCRSNDSRDLAEKIIFFFNKHKK